MGNAAHEPPREGGRGGGGGDRVPESGKSRRMNGQDPSQGYDFPRARSFQVALAGQ